MSSAAFLVLIAGPPANPKVWALAHTALTLPVVGGHRGSNSCVAKSAKIVSVKSGKRELEKGL
jgi:hypothetical protein